jgi:hypothetical protein
MHLRTCLLAAAGAAVLAPAAGAAPVALPSVHRTLTATSCTHGLTAASRTARTSYLAPMSGFLTVRTVASDATDFDARLVDAASGRVLARSQSFGSHEVLQSWVTPAQRLRVEACRRSGRATALTVSLSLLDAVPPAPARSHASIVDVQYKSNADLARLDAAGLDVTHTIRATHAEVLAPDAAALGTLRRMGLPFTTKIADLDAFEARARRAEQRQAAAGVASGLPSGRTTYRTYDDIQAELKKLAADKPTMVRKVVLPKKSVQGREVQGIEISRNVNADDGKPTFFLMAVHHAREWPAAETAMEFANLLLKNPNANPRVDSILNTTRVVVVPLINPDGYVASRGAPVSPGDASGNTFVQTGEAVIPFGGQLAYRRKNCAGPLPADSAPCELQWGVDPNRNYGEGWGGKGAGTDVNTQSYRGPGPWSEPETQGVHEFSQTREVTGLITLHTNGALVLRPPSISEKGNAPDEKGLKSLGDAMAKATGYTSQYSFQLYDTSGTTEDWNYAAAGTYGYTIELGGAGFHGPYEGSVVDQWTGKATKKGGLEEALLIAAEKAGNPNSHAILEGKATAGNVLRIKKAFETKSAEICTYAQGYVNSTGVPGQASAINCVGQGAVYPRITIPDKLDMTTVVPKNGHFEWHVNQSTRPFVGWKYDTATKDIADLGKRESYTLTCESPSGKVLSTSTITIDRGQRKTIKPGC